MYTVSVLASMCMQAVFYRRYSINEQENLKNWIIKSWSPYTSCFTFA